MKPFTSIFSIFSVLLSVSSLHAIDPEAVVKEAETIITARQHSADPIPTDVFDQAKAVGIIKGTQGGLVIGGSGGEGVVSVHDAKGWSAPLFFHLASHSFGPQVGVESKEYLFILNSDNVVKLFTGDEQKHFRVLGQYTVASSHDSLIATGDLPPEELAVYTQNSGGAFVGATFGDAAVGSSPEINTEVYGVSDTDQILSGKVKAPLYAQSLQDLLKKVSGGPRVKLEK